MTRAPVALARLWRVALLGMVGLSVSACAPRLAPLAGELAPVTFPIGTLPAGHHQMNFAWEYADPDFSGKGEGVARVASPDSLRLDFFLGGGFAVGGAVLIGDSVETPGGALGRSLIPPPTMLWASIGRTALPVTRDTAIRRDGDFLRADLGIPVAWRVTFRQDTLIRLERVERNRVVEWVERRADNWVEYRQESSRRSLKLHITRVDDVAAFESSIWHFDH